MVIAISNSQAETLADGTASSEELPTGNDVFNGRGGLQPNASDINDEEKPVLSSELLILPHAEQFLGQDQLDLTPEEDRRSTLEPQCQFLRASDEALLGEGRKGKLESYFKGKNDLEVPGQTEFHRNESVPATDASISVAAVSSSGN